MAKRFTDTEKWSKKWFRKLSPAFKLAWMYLCDNCNLAGIINLDTELADFQIGMQVDWEAVLSESDGRIERLPNGRWWLTTFVPFQHPHGLSRKCNAQAQVLDFLEENGISERMDEWLSNSTPTVQQESPDSPGKGNGNGPGNGKGKGGAGGKPKLVTAALVPVPKCLETPAVREAIAEWLDYKSKKGKPYKDAGFLGRKVAEFNEPSVFISAVHSSIGNNYDGIYAPGISTNRSRNVGPGQQYDPSVQTNTSGKFV